MAEKICCSTLIPRDKKLLLIQESVRGFRRWGIPGGTLKHGETLGEAAARETHEETGARVALTGYLGKYCLPPTLERPRPLIRVVFLAELLEGEQIVPPADITAGLFTEKRIARLGEAQLRGNATEQIIADYFAHDGMYASEELSFIANLVPHPAHTKQTAGAEPRAA